MENKGTTTSSPTGICEKLFNALHLNPTFRSFRRIAHRPQEPIAAAAIMPPPPPLVPNSVGRAPTPPKASGLGYAGGAAGDPHQSGVPEKKAPEAKPPRIKPESVTVSVKTPSKGFLETTPSKVEPQAAAIPSSKSFTYTDPKAPPPSQLPSERALSASRKSLPPTPTSPPRAVSKLDDVKASVDSTKPAAPETGRTRTRKNLNEKVDEYINRTRNKMRSGSNLGSSSSKEQGK